MKTLSQTPEETKTARANDQSKPAQTAENTENLIHVGDVLDVDVIGSTEYDWRGTLTPEGFLDGINFVEEPIFALCRTPEAVASDVARGYEKLLRNPEIAVKIIDRSRRPAAILYGAVKTPQRFQIYRSVKLNELLILSGGISEKASGEIQIIRSPVLSCAAKKNAAAEPETKGQPPNVSAPEKQENGARYINVKIADLLKGGTESNPQILSGDVITVFESKPVYVTGGVANPGQISARAELNVSRAVDAAGGVTKDADPKKIAIFRVENNETKVFEVDLNKIKSGLAQDFMLKPFDIVEVSQKGKDRRKYLPVSDAADTRKNNVQNLPLKIID